MKKEIINVLTELELKARNVYDNKIVEDYDQTINKSGEIEILEIIGLIREKREELEKEILK